MTQIRRLARRSATSTSAPSAVSLALAAGLAALLLHGAPAAAASSADDFRPLLKERKFEAAEALARERIAKDAKDDVALWYLARMIGGDPKKREELLPRIEKCTADLPQSAKCHHAAGMLYGSAALSSGLMNGIKYASKIKESFLRAVELDPSSFDARNDLNQFYLQAPGIAGGSVRKAIDNAAAHEKINAFEGRLLRAQIHVYEKEFDKAEAILGALKPTAGSEGSAEALSQAWSGLGFAMISDKKAAAAQSLFERRLAADMDNAVLHFGLGRAYLENNAVDSAIASLERALKLDAKLNAHYRLGIAYQTKGDKPRAIAAFQQFLTYATSGKAAEDARARLESLKKI